jgi:hypothetical protein
MARKLETRLPSLEAAARVVGPMLGGLLLGGTLLSSVPLLGSVLGALAGIAAGLARNRELSQAAR